MDCPSCASNSFLRNTSGNSAGATSEIIDTMGDVDMSDMRTELQTPYFPPENDVFGRDTTTTTTTTTTAQGAIPNGAPQFSGVTSPQRSIFNDDPIRVGNGNGMIIDEVNDVFMTDISRGDVPWSDRQVFNTFETEV